MLHELSDVVITDMLYIYITDIFIYKWIKEKLHFLQFFFFILKR